MPTSGRDDQVKENAIVTDLQKCHRRALELAIGLESIRCLCNRFEHAGADASETVGSAKQTTPSGTKRRGCREYPKNADIGPIDPPPPARERDTEWGVDRYSAASILSIDPSCR